MDHSGPSTSSGGGDCINGNCYEQNAIIDDQGHRCVPKQKATGNEKKRKQVVENNLHENVLCKKPRPSTSSGGGDCINGNCYEQKAIIDDQGHRCVPKQKATGNGPSTSTGGDNCMNGDGYEQNAITDEHGQGCVPKQKAAGNGRDASPASAVVYPCLSVDTLRQHSEFLEEVIDPDSGLLDELSAFEALTNRDFCRIREEKPYQDRNARLLTTIQSNKIAYFEKALKNTGQGHVVNYLVANGEYRPQFGSEWPLTKRQLSGITINQRYLVDVLDTSELIPKLYARNVINARQRDKIFSKETPDEKNIEFLQILRRRSQKDYENMIECLAEIKQFAIVRILTEDAVIVKVHVKTDETPDQEREISAELNRELCNIPDEGRELDEPIIVAAKEGQSILLYVQCHTFKHIEMLRKSLESGKFKEITQQLFGRLLNRSKKPNVLGITVNDGELERANLLLDVLNKSGNTQTISRGGHLAFHFAAECVNTATEDHVDDHFLLRGIKVGDCSMADYLPRQVADMNSPDSSQTKHFQIEKETMDLGKPDPPLYDLAEENSSTATDDHVHVQTLLLMNVEIGDCSAVESLLRNGADVNCPVLSQTGHSQIAKETFDSGKHDSPLHVAVRLCNGEMVKTLHDHGAEVNLPNWRDLTPLHIAAAFGHVEMVELLIDRGANFNANSYTVIAPPDVTGNYGAAEVTELLSRDMTDDRFFWKRNNPIHLAATFGHVKVVKILLDHYERLCASGVHDPLMQEFIKRTALERAIKFHQPEVVELLLKKGANPFDIFDFETGNENLLKTKPSNLESNTLSDEPEITASRQLRVLDILFTSGQFNVNSLNSAAETPLHQVLRKCWRCDSLINPWKSHREQWINDHGDNSIVKKLLEYGANVNQTNCKGETALMLAAQNGCEYNIRILLDCTKNRGIKLLLDTRDVLGETALLKAIEHRQVRVVKILLKNGASANVHDNRGFTALHAARYRVFNWVKSDYLYLSNELRRRKFDLDSKFQKWFKKHFAFTSRNIDKSKESIAKGEIVKLLLKSPAAIETSVHFAGNTAWDLEENWSEALADEMPEEGILITAFRSKNISRLERFCVDDWGRTPLHRLCIPLRSDHYVYENEVIEKIVRPSRMVDMTRRLRKGEVKYSASLRDNRGRTALHYVATSPDHLHRIELYSLIKMLLNIGIDINAVDGFGRTPLHYASDDRMYDWLVDLGANEQIRDNRDHTPKYLNELCERIEKLNAPIIHTKFVNEKPIGVSKLWRLHDKLIGRQRNISQLVNVTRELVRFVERLASAIGERDQRFSCKSKLVGSAAEGTKIEIPGDFDFDLTLTELSKRCEVHPSPVAPDGFVHLKRKNYGSEYIFYRTEDDFDNFFNEDQLLLVNEIDSRFKMLLEEVLQDPHFWRNDETFELRNFWKNCVSPSSLQRRIDLKMIHPLTDEDGDLYFNDLRLNIVPCMHIDNWWPDEALENVEAEVKSLGCNLIFDSPCRSCPWVPFDETYARISFSQAESHIIKNSAGVLKDAYCLAKLLCSEETFLNSGMKNVAYVLKSSFLYCIEAFGTSWIVQGHFELSINPAKTLRFLLERILFCFVEFYEQDFLPFYLMPTFSLPVDNYLKSKHIESFLNGDTKEISASEVRDFYTSLLFGDLESDFETDTTETDLDSDLEKDTTEPDLETDLEKDTTETLRNDFSNPVIQPLRECFNREAFMRKLSDLN